MPKYRCIRKCYFAEKLWNEGDVLISQTDKGIPHHFEEVIEKAVEPEKTEGEESTETEEDSEESKEEEIERLRAECEKLGKPYDKRWGKYKLEETIMLAKKGL